ncbi:preprotein translocase subunit SecY [Nanoarchaeota archaeon]
MGLIDDILSNLPEVAPPTQKRLSFKEKLKWTSAILVLFYVLGLVPLFGLGVNALAQFEALSIILGAQFGSIISLGIGPIVTASIVLQLLNGSGIVKFDLNTHEGKKRFQGIQKVLAVFFILFEAAIYVFMGGLAPAEIFRGTPAYFIFEIILVIQLFVGGILILFMDEVISKWGFGSGVSLFIAANVSQGIFVRALSPLPSPSNPEMMTGAIPGLFQALANNDVTGALTLFFAVFFTIVVFVVAVYGQAMKVEIPLSFGRVRGHGIRWPLSFMYTSNIPVILIAALMANFQLWARLLERAGYPLLGTFSGNTPISGFVTWLYPPNIVRKIIDGNLNILNFNYAPDLGFLGSVWQTFSNSDVLHGLVYMLILMLGSMVFSIFWVQTSGMDAKSQAKNIMSSGLQIPGFRRDPRILERVLERYIGPLTVMGGLAIGFLAALADLSGALGNGTGILLAVMIIYRLYEEIAKQHMMDMHPMMRKFME